MDYGKTIFPAACHPLYDALKKETEQYFLDNRPFPDDASRDKFLKEDYTLCAALFFPKARDDRIGFAARIYTLIFFLEGKITAHE
jgi:hypothetical protein